MCAIKRLIGSGRMARPKARRALTIVAGSASFRTLCVSFMNRTGTRVVASENVRAVRGGRALQRDALQFVRGPINGRGRNRGEGGLGGGGVRSQLNNFAGLFPEQCLANRGLIRD